MSLQVTRMPPAARMPLAAARMPLAAARMSLAAALLAGGAGWAAPAAQDLEPPLPIAAVRAVAADEAGSFDGVVQSVRQTVVTAQVPGAVVALPVKAGDAVRAGALLLRLDARTAEQAAAASAAQVAAAQAAEAEAARELARQRQLFEKRYVSQAALERAQARHDAARAQAAAQRASAGAARTQSGLHVVAAPYDGVIAGVAVELGDMAMPGRPLLTLYDPRALRVSVDIPHSVAARMAPDAMPTVTLATGPARPIRPVRLQWLPVADPGTHTVELRLDLPADLPGVVPGAFARVHLPAAGSDQRLVIPASAIVRRAELTAVYVLGADDRPMLRQVRIGRASGDAVEVLTGLARDERVVLDPAAAARLR